MDLNRWSSSDDEQPSLTPPSQSAQAITPEKNDVLHPQSHAEQLQPPQSSGVLLCQELLSVCNNDYQTQQLHAARKASNLPPMLLGPRLGNTPTPATTSETARASSGASHAAPQTSAPDAKRVRQVKAAERLQAKVSPPAPDVLKMLQVPRADSVESLGQPGDFRVKLALTVCSTEPVANCGVCVFCLDKPKFGGAGAAWHNNWHSESP